MRPPLDGPQGLPTAERTVLITYHAILAAANDTP